MELTFCGFLLVMPAVVWSWRFLTPGLDERASLASAIATLLSYGIGAVATPYSDEFAVLLFTAIAVILGLSYRQIAIYRRNSLTDALTGIPNRRHLEQAARDSWASCLYIDLDGFKIINDRRGHVVGDQVLIKVAACLLTVSQKYGGEAVRMGGDEFLIHLPESGCTAYEIATEALQAVQDLKFDPDSIRASIGIANRQFADLCLDSDQMLAAAEAAARHAKADRTSMLPGIRIREWNEELADQLSRQQQMESALRSCRRADFSLVYQPVVALKTGKIIGAETLLRWSSPDLGPIPPGEFIPVAESIGLIHQLSDWVMEESFVNLKRWAALIPDFSIAINISPVEIDQPGFIERIQRRMGEADIPPQWVELEITERGVFRNLARCLQVLGELQELSIRLKVDDFGLGQSGLAQVLRFAFNGVKVDRCFIDAVEADPVALAICEAVVVLSRGSHFTLVAEGIERASQVKVMQDLGYQDAQGFFFARPMPANELDALLHTQSHLPHFPKSTSEAV